jgi:hypothetical protein
MPAGTGEERPSLPLGPILRLLDEIKNFPGTPLAFKETKDLFPEHFLISFDE